MEVGLAVDSFKYNNEEMWFELVVKCTEVPSVNNAHGINTKNRVVYDMPWLRQFKSELNDQLIFADPRKKCPWLTTTNTYSIAIKYLLKQHFWSRDLDNLHKFTQDRVAESCGINDNRIIEVHMWKNFRPGDHEYLIIRLAVSHYDYNQFR